MTTPFTGRDLLKHLIPNDKARIDFMTRALWARVENPALYPSLLEQTLYGASRMSPLPDQVAAVTAFLDTL